MNIHSVKTFKIADVFISMDIWQDLPSFSMLEPFACKESEKGEQSIEVSVRVGEAVDKENLRLLSKFDKYSLYEDDEYFYRFYTEGFVDGFGEYACTRIKKGQFSRVDCTVFEGKTGAVPEMRHLLDILPIEVLMLNFSKILLHSSYIVHNGKAILFTAPCGTGKSTQASLWETHENARIINGDRAIIGKDGNGTFCAYGVPFCGSSKISENVTMPIGAIVVLRQAKENTLERLSAISAFKNIYSELTLCNIDGYATQRAMNVLEELIEAVPVYMLACTKDERAVETLKKAIKTE